MSRSSILNFESLEGVTLRWPKTLLAVVGIIVALEVAVRLIPEKNLMPKVSRQGEIFFMEQEVLPKFDAPKIVLLGSSRMRRSIVPAQLDAQLGLKKGSTINLGLAMARVYESLYFYERNEEQLKHAEWVIFNLDEWHVSSGPKITNSLYETHGPLWERLQFPDRQRTRLFLDGLFHIRVNLRLVPSLFFPRKKDVQNLKLDDNNQVLLPDEKPKIMTAAKWLKEYHDKIDQFYGEHFDVNSVMLGHIEKLANKVKANGGRFVLMQLPNRAAYQTEVETYEAREIKRTHRQDYENERAAVERLAQKLEVPLLFYRLPEEIGLSDADYEDYGHLTPKGAEKVTTFLGKTIEELKAKY